MVLGAGSGLVQVARQPGDTPHALVRSRGPPELLPEREHDARARLARECRFAPGAGRSGRSRRVSHRGGTAVGLFGLCPGNDLCSGSWDQGKNYLEGIWKQFTWSPLNRIWHTFRIYSVYLRKGVEGSRAGPDTTDTNPHYGYGISTVPAQHRVGIMDRDSSEVCGLEAQHMDNSGANAHIRESAMPSHVTDFGGVSIQAQNRAPDVGTPTFCSMH